MRRTLFSFILSVVGLVAVSAEEYTGVLVTSGDLSVRYLFQDKPTVKCQQVEGVMNACFYIAGKTDPVISVPMQNGQKLSVCFDKWIVTNLNNVSETSVRDGKFIENGKLVILKNGMRYNVAGQIIKQ